MDIKDEIKRIAKNNAGEIVNLRRHLHSNPELSFQEYETAKFVADSLKSIGLTPVEGIAKTGVTAVIKGKNPDKKVIALRGDIDALPIVEANDVPYKSKKEGVMHACGHDVHTSSLFRNSAYFKSAQRSV